MSTTNNTKTVNVNEEEIAKFEKVASQWWDLDGDFKPLHQINPIRRQFICQHVGDIFGKKIIDVGQAWWRCYWD
jgi:2-polyprenyl-6-hydroxyphenyl methylase/3-demethylubiquinone-9 3-methyltransferase